MIPVVLYGQTGSGKTSLLRELAGRGFPVIDLELLANHRGSAFGHLNIKFPQPSQKEFEEKINISIEESNYSRFIFLEFESSNLGKLRIPDYVLALYRDGVQVLLKTEIDERVQYILDEYLPTEKNLLVESLHKLKDRIEGEDYNFDEKKYQSVNLKSPDQKQTSSNSVLLEDKFLNLRSLLESGHYKEFCYQILGYYDNSKYYSQPARYDYQLDNQGSKINADRLLSWMYERYLASDLTTGSTLS